jgi:hypothetical protein
MAVAIGALEQTAYPPRVLVSVTGLTVGDDVELFRVVAGERTAVRAGAATDVADTSFLRVDAELPFGVPLSYLVVVNGSAEVETAADTYTLPGGNVALSDAITGQSAEVVIRAFPSRTRARVNGVFAVGGRNVVVSGELSMFIGQLELYVEAASSVDNTIALLEDATESIVQLRVPLPVYARYDAYVAVLSVEEVLFSQDGSDSRRILQLDVVEVEGWAPALEASGFTLQDIADFYTSGDLQDIADDYTTLLLLAQGDFS